MFQGRVGKIHVDLFVGPVEVFASVLADSKQHSPERGSRIRPSQSGWAIDGRPVGSSRASTKRSAY